MITSEKVVSVGIWKIELLNDNEEKWWVLRKQLAADQSDDQISIPFDEVKAGGSLINLNYNGERSATIKGALDGVNSYDERSHVPKNIVEVLEEIGPW